ncbi:hypothetical protein M501DRAFT_1017137 [Patellaria atrata CBS 101060]|uniref:Na+/H+ antiporter n=1 Tax=Patellaria atrata CBS 101060 TaxID=1346257 RepID=A0A9P4VNV3_9PEZI|nr:hypothetical protein M501DRAFT_1017137 [Patellaria atrata CBS 101060]
MAWEHLSINKPHLVYIILGGFTSLFMLCSSIIKEKFYIGEATVATICGIIFGPHAANLIDPSTWGNVDQITLEFSRIVLVVQCFAVGVELPKAYMEKHWRSVTFLLIPVMTFGWLMTSLFIWWILRSHLDWLDSLCIAACVTATDPVLASSVVGKGKFAKRVPKHLRDLLSAESGCNDGMAFPFIYLAVYLIRYRPDASEVAFHWICYTVLYECIFGAIYGVIIGYLARRAIRYAHEHDLIDRESFLVFYFVLALFCAGSGSLLGMDDLLVGFACGVGFSNDGWFLEKTEESHVSNVIDLLINLAFFVYFGTIIPWASFNSEILGLSPWRLVVIGILVLFFRRIPIMLALKPVIPDLKTWREAMFAGHFGPIGVGALFVAILARAELETEETTPLAVIPEPGFPHLNIIEIIWPVTTFLVVVSIVVHGSSIAVFTLGKHINTLTITLSYTQANEDGPKWMERLPRIQSRSKSSMSLGRADDSSMDEKMDYPPGSLPPVGVAGQFLRRQKEEDPSQSRSSSLKPSRRKKWDAGLGPGGPISQSAIHPQRLHRDQSDVGTAGQSGSDTIAINSDESPDGSGQRGEDVEEPEGEVFEEGDKTVYEDEEGNVLGVEDHAGESEETRKREQKKEGAELLREKDVQHGVAQTEEIEPVEETKKLGKDFKEGLAHPQNRWRNRVNRVQSYSGGLMARKGDGADASKKPEVVPKRGPARAYQFGNTVIVEDEDGEVIKTYTMPAHEGADRKKNQGDPASTRQRLNRVVSYFGPGRDEPESSKSAADGKKKKVAQDDEDDDKIRFTVEAGGRRMSKLEFIKQIRQMDPKARAQLVEEADAPESVIHESRMATGRRQTDPRADADVSIEHVASHEERPAGPGGLTLVDSRNEDIPFHSVHDDLARYSMGGQQETAAQRRRRLASPSGDTTSGSEDEGPRARQKERAGDAGKGKIINPAHIDEGETAAEKKRREEALGLTKDEDTDDDEESRATPGLRQPPAQKAPGIRFAEQITPQQQTKERGEEDPLAEKSAPGPSSPSGSKLKWANHLGWKGKK